MKLKRSKVLSLSPTASLCALVSSGEAMCPRPARPIEARCNPRAARPEWGAPAHLTGGYAAWRGLESERIYAPAAAAGDFTTQLQFAANRGPRRMGERGKLSERGGAAAVAVQNEARFSAHGLPNSPHAPAAAADVPICAARPSAMSA